MPQPATRRLVTEAALVPLKTRIDALDGKGQRGYTIDQSVGRVVRVWDYLNNREQIIYGDTGLRNIGALLEIASTAGTVQISRSAQGVTVTLAGVAPSANGSDILMTLPSGFRPARTIFFYASGITELSQITQYGKVQLYNWTKGLPIYGTATFQTSDPWPASLPGTPV